MDNKPVRVLVVAPLKVGGVTMMMLNIQKNLDRDKVNFDYLTFHEGKEPNEDVAIAMGSKKYVASVDNLRFSFVRRFARMSVIKRLCKENNIKILHYNADTPADLMNIMAAKAGGVEYVTMHSHNAGFGVAGLGIKAFSFILKPFIPKYCDNFLGCSDLAARFLFPKSVIKKGHYSVLKNGIDIEKYRFDLSTREEKRREFGLEDCFVVGHVGRFVPQKNHSFLIDIFAELHKSDPKAVLVLFGVGELMDSVKKKVNELGLEKSVKFMGTSSEMNLMWNIMDVFVMPSLHEGLPVTGIEAQANGLQCFFSDEVTREVDVSTSSRFLSLGEGADLWAKAILNTKGMERYDCTEKLYQEGYDIKQTAEKVSNLYFDL